MCLLSRQSWREALISHFTHILALYFCRRRQECIQIFLHISTLTSVMQLFDNFWHVTRSILWGSLSEHVMNTIQQWTSASKRSITWDCKPTRTSQTPGENVWVSLAEEKIVLIMWTMLSDANRGTSRLKTCYGSCERILGKTKYCLLDNEGFSWRSRAPR